jgi:hypothetical protein
VVGPGRFELPTSPLSGARSNLLSYEPTGSGSIPRCPRSRPSVSQNLNMNRRELRELLGVAPADLVSYAGAIALAVPFFSQNPIADYAFSVIGIGFLGLACWIGARPDPALAEWLNIVRLISYPFLLLLGIGAVVVHYMFFA